jgi:hypothetical protein
MQRFHTMARQATDNAATQAALLATMRRAGDVPYRRELPSGHGAVMVTQ